MNGWVILIFLQTELLLDRLVLLCSTVILKHVNLYNACYVLVEATHLSAEELSERIQSFMAVNMDFLLDSGILDDLDPTMVKQLTGYIRAKQEEESPITRSGRLTNDVMTRHADWLASQPPSPPEIDLLQEEFLTVVRSPPKMRRKTSSLNQDSSPHPSPPLRPQRAIRRPPSNDEIFAMDEPDDPAIPMAGDVQPPQPVSRLPASPSSIWKAPVVPRSVNMPNPPISGFNTQPFL